jgi:tetratricopeptide (TPR) repeat protein
MALFKRIFGSGQSDDPAALVARGNLHYQKREFDEAVACFTRALELGSRDVQALIGRGQAYLDLGNEPLAREDFTEALGQDRRAVRGHFFWRGQAWGEQDQRDREVATYTYVLDLDPQFALAYASRANAYRELQDYPRALADCDAALRLDPSDALYASRGLVHFEMGDFGRMLADFNEAIRLNPGQGSHYLNRAAAYRGLGDRENEVADEDRARQLGPS